MATVMVVVLAIIRIMMVKMMLPLLVVCIICTAVTSATSKTNQICWKHVIVSLKHPFRVLLKGSFVVGHLVAKSIL